MVMLHTIQLQQTSSPLDVCHCHSSFLRYKRETIVISHT
jgi:hypothetical protein